MGKNEGCSRDFYIAQDALCGTMHALWKARLQNGNGFIPRTLHPDGDPLDVLVMTNEPTFAGCVIEARPLGVFHGDPDDKILAAPHTDPLFNEYRALEVSSQ